VLPPAAADLFHQIRLTGNEAVHEAHGTHRQALAALKMARELGVWFHRSFGPDSTFSPGPFVPPMAPEDASQPLAEEIARLRDAAAQALSAAEQAQARASEQAQALLSAEERAGREAEDRAVWEQLAQHADSELQRVSKELSALQAAAQQQAPKQIDAMLERASLAARQIDLDEASTRALIDQQLREVGWEVDSATLRFSTGARPAKGRHLAIAEWPTSTGPADYALFAGMMLVGVIEAKRRNRNVMEVLPQAERYARSIELHGAELPGGSPWGGHHVPFAFSTNGRPYLKQLETLSGIWRRDLRRPTNPAGVLDGWPTPEGLLERLQVDIDTAHAALAEQDFDFGFTLRDYQKRAIQAVERELAADRRTLLVAMANEYAT